MDNNILHKHVCVGLDAIRVFDFFWGCSKHHEEGPLLSLTEYPYLIFSLSVPQGPGLGECLVVQIAGIGTRDSLGDRPVRAEKCF